MVKLSLSPYNPMPWFNGCFVMVINGAIVLMLIMALASTWSDLVIKTYYQIITNDMFIILFATMTVVVLLLT